MQFQHGDRRYIAAQWTQHPHYGQLLCEDRNGDNWSQWPCAVTIYNLPKDCLSVKVTIDGAPLEMLPTDHGTIRIPLANAVHKITVTIL
jgi:hypothetical protein